MSNPVLEVIPHKHKTKQSHLTAHIVASGPNCDAVQSQTLNEPEATFPPDSQPEIFIYQQIWLKVLPI